MYYTITLNDNTKLTLQCQPSIQDSTLLLIDKVSKVLIASYSAGNWKSIIKTDDKGNSIK